MSNDSLQRAAHIEAVRHANDEVKTIKDKPEHIDASLRRIHKAGVAFVLCAACCCGCVSTVRLPPDALRPTPSGSQIDASVGFSRCNVIPSTTAWEGRANDVDAKLGLSAWYTSFFSEVHLDFVPADVAEALRGSRLFVRGFNSSDPAADLQMDLTVNVGCSVSDGALMLSSLLAIGTLGVWPLLGGPFPTAAKSGLVCELFPVDSRTESRVYRSVMSLSGWAPLYTIARKDNDLAARSLAGALQNVVDQIIRDQSALNQAAQAAQIKRASRQANASSPPAHEPEPLVLPPVTWTLDSIALADLTAYVLSEGEAKTLTEKLHSALVDTMYFRVLSRSDMKDVLEAQKFSRTGACDDSACLVEMGKILSVVRIVGGSLGKVGNTFSLSLRIVNIETGETEVTVDRQLKSESDQLLPLMERVARELALKYSTFKKTR